MGLHNSAKACRVPNPYSAKQYDTVKPLLIRESEIQRQRLLEYKTYIHLLFTSVDSYSDGLIVNCFLLPDNIKTSS